MSDTWFSNSAPDYSMWQRRAGEAYAPLLAAAQKYGVDPNMVFAVARAESAFNPRAQSGAGASGLMQLMPGTARDMGVRNVWDPHQNALGGAGYLKKMSDFTGGGLNDVLAAYNWGPGNWQKWKARGGDYSQLPKGTRDYISRIRDFLGKGTEADSMNGYFGGGNAWGPSGMAPSAGDEEYPGLEALRGGGQAQPAAAGGVDPDRLALALGLLQAGASVSAANRRGGARLGDLLGAGGGGFAQGYGSALAYDQQRQAGEQQQKLQQLKMQMEMAKQAKDLQKKYQYVTSTDPWGNAVGQAFDPETGMVRSAAPGVPAMAMSSLNAREALTGGQQRGGGGESEFVTPEDLAAGLPPMLQGSLNARAEMAGERGAGSTRAGQTVDALGTPVNLPGNVKWDKPTDVTLPDGSVVREQWDTTHQFRRELGPGYDENAEKRKLAAQKEVKGQERAFQQTNLMQEDIDRAISIIEKDWQPTTGFLGDLASSVPGTSAHTLSQMLQSLGGQVSLNALQELKAASSTGGAGLGALSDAEGAMLRSSLGSLSQTLPKDELLFNLRRIKALLSKAAGNTMPYAQGHINSDDEDWEDM